MNNNTKTTILIIVISLVLMLSLKTCSCSKKSRKPKKAGIDKKKIAKIVDEKPKKLEKSKEKTTVKENRVSNFNFNHRETEQLYKRLDYAFSLYNRYNYEMAINEVEGLITRINNDPYLEAQAWAMAAMIYEKQRKLSRRKRAYRKMVGAIEALQKDKRYYNVYKEGMENQQLFDALIKAGGSKYAEVE